MESQSANGAEPPDSSPRSEDSPGLILVTNGIGRGRRYKIADKAVIGRGVQAEICIDDPALSRAHAQIGKDEKTGRFIFTDLGSCNGSKVNGVAVSAQELAYGDKIRLGTDLELLFSRFDAEEDQILQRQRLETLGRLGAGIAHDFNNMQGVILSTIEYLRQLSPGSTMASWEVRECLADIEAAASRSTELASNLLSFAKADRQGYTDVSVTSICTEGIQMIRRTFGRSIRVKAEIQPDLQVIGCSGELHQVLMNLAVNARDAMPEGGDLRLKLLLLQPAQLAGKPLSTEGPHVLLQIRDTGIGMNEQIRKRVFESFFTTKREGAGFGLGLATVQDIVTRHGGIVELESQVGRGTTVRVYLPTHQDAKRKQAATVDLRMPPPVKHQGLILLIEHEEMVRKSLARVLRQAGYDVSTAGSGSEGLALYAEQPVRPDLVLLDMDLPTMTGQDVFELLEELDPNARVVLVTGHQLDHQRTAGALGVIQKPCSAHTLLSGVARAAAAASLSTEDDFDDLPTVKRTVPVGDKRR